MLPFMLILLSAVIAASLAGTGAMRTYAMRRRLVDIPNHRSSHERLVPLGGGVALVCAALAGIAGAWLLGWADGRLAASLIIGGGVLAIVGWADDRQPLSPYLRASVQVAIGALAVAVLGGLPALSWGGAALPLGPAGAVLAVIGIVWMCNLFNFMDGIDGLAGGQAALAGISGGILTWTLGSPTIAMLPLITSAAALGFLFWNWQPAKIFMGDAGSLFLGYSFAVIAIASENSGSLPLLWWCMILGVFLFDATVTLLRRMIRRENWIAPHRMHAYQRLSRSGFSHARTTGSALGVGTIITVLAAAGLYGILPPALAGAAGLLFLVISYWLVERRLPMTAESPDAGQRNAGRNSGVLRNVAPDARARDSRVS